MLNITVKMGHWIKATHTSGDVLWIKIDDEFVQTRPGRVRLSFDDDERNFEIQRDVEHTPEKDIIRRCKSNSGSVLR